ncbi:hypothetical protein B0J14DRAFT_680266 [Halenospora varia]|nr:hypothetical protein B0J14DRAFT_680266 [Halenospora varia]
MQVLKPKERREPAVYLLKELKIEHIQRLTRALRIGIGNSPDEEWLEEQKKGLKSLPFKLARPKWYTNPVRKAGNALNWTSKEAFLCEVHKKLNGQLIRRLFLQICAEVTTRLRQLVLHGYLPQHIMMHIVRLQCLNNLWMSPAMYEAVFKITAPPTGEFDRVPSGCEACILAVIGGNRHALTDLRASMRGRGFRRRDRHGRLKTESAPPRLLRFVDAWIKQAGDEYVCNDIMDRSENLAHDIRKVMKEVRRERERRRELEKLEGETSCSTCSTCSTCSGSDSGTEIRRGKRPESSVGSTTTWGHETSFSPRDGRNGGRPQTSTGNAGCGRSPERRRTPSPRLGRAATNPDGFRTGNDSDEDSILNLYADDGDVNEQGHTVEKENPQQEVVGYYMKNFSDREIRGLRGLSQADIHPCYHDSGIFDTESRQFLHPTHQDFQPGIDEGGPSRRKSIPKREPIGASQYSESVYSRDTDGNSYGIQPEDSVSERSAFMGARAHWAKQPGISTVKPKKPGELGPSSTSSGRSKGTTKSKKPGKHGSKSTKESNSRRAEKQERQDNAWNNFADQVNNLPLGTDIYKAPETSRPSPAATAAPRTQPVSRSPPAVTTGVSTMSVLRLRPEGPTSPSISAVLGSRPRPGRAPSLDRASVSTRWSDLYRG